MKTDWILKLLFFFIGVLIIGLLFKPTFETYCVTCKTDAECADGMKCVDGCCEAQ